MRRSALKAILRSAILAAGLASSVAISMTPASATPPATGGVVVFSGTAAIDCFGCGVSQGTAELTGSGVVGTNVVTNGSAHADYSVSELNVSPACVITGSASGTVTGAINVAFNWTRVGATAVITTTGDITGAGVAGFAVTAPVGIPCGGPVTADVAGVVAGI